GAAVAGDVLVVLEIRDAGVRPDALAVFLLQQHMLAANVGSIGFAIALERFAGDDGVAEAVRERVGYLRLGVEEEGLIVEKIVGGSPIVLHRQNGILRTEERLDLESAPLDVGLVVNVLFEIDQVENVLLFDEGQQFADRREVVVIDAWRKNPIGIV